MRSVRNRFVIRGLSAALVGLGFATCDWNDPDDVQNSSNFAIVRAQFFASRTSRVPVPGVRMIVESDPDGETPLRSPDVVSISGEDGVAVAKVFPGITEQQQGTGGAGGTTGQQPLGPRNPLELPPPQYFGDAAVVLLYNARIVRLIDGGLTIASGRQYDLGAVFLEELGMVVD